MDGNREGRDLRPATSSSWLLWMLGVVGAVWIASLLTGGAERSSPDGGEPPLASGGERPIEEEVGFDPCVSPMGWRTGSLDPRFDLPAEELRGAIERAVLVWESSTGRLIFRQDSLQGMPINLTYDARQARLEALERRARELDELGAQIEELRAEYYRTDDADLAERVNRMADEYNVMADSLTRSRSIRIDAGQFRENILYRGRPIRTDPQLTVYQFGSIDELVWILAHELGHAIGLEHVDEPAAVMHDGYRSGVSVEALHPVDLAAFDELCGSPEAGSNLGPTGAVR